jgi:hypothetical protein
MRYVSKLSIRKKELVELVKTIERLPVKTLGTIFNATGIGIASVRNLGYTLHSIEGEEDITKWTID